MEIVLMKTLLPFLLLGLLAVPAKGAEPDDQPPPAPEGKAWKLVWHDEFDGDKLDGTKWDVPDNRRHGRISHVRSLVEAERVRLLR